MPMGKGIRPALERLMAMVEIQPNGCWWFTGHLTAEGYGKFRYKETQTTAHKASYDIHVGPVPSGKVLDHTCHDPNVCRLGDSCPHRRCVNPDHLEPVTNAENARRSGSGLFHSRKTHCPQGHEYTKENTFRPSATPNERHCRICRRRRTTEWKRKTGYVANGKRDTTAPTAA